MSGFKEFGNWDGIMRMVSKMPDEIDRVNQKSLKKIALKTEREAVLSLRNQDQPWVPLKPEYLAYKTSKGKSEKILIASSTYIQNITSVDKKNQAFAGVLRNARSEDGEILANIAVVHEFGSIARNIPARPLWVPVSKKIHKFVTNTKFFTKEVLNYLRSKYAG